MRRFGGYAIAALFCASLLPSAYAGVGQIAAVVYQILDQLGITSGGSYTPPTLQAVTDAGATTTNDLTLDGCVVGGYGADGLKLTIDGNERVRFDTDGLSILDTAGNRPRLVTSGGDLQVRTSGGSVAAIVSSSGGVEITQRATFAGPTAADNCGVAVTSSALAISTGSGAPAITFPSPVAGQQDFVIDYSGATGQVRLGKGSASLPALAFAGSPTTGIYAAAADRINFAVSGSGAGSVSSSGWSLAAAVFSSWTRSRESNTAGAGSPNVLTGTETGLCLDNTGTGAENYHTLPSAVAGYHFIFSCSNANGIRVVALAGDNIRLDGVTSATAGYINSFAVGSSVTLLAIDSTTWLAVSYVGPWSVDGVYYQATQNGNTTLTDATATTVLSVVAADDLDSASIVLDYSIRATDGTDLQLETGTVQVNLANKDGTITAATPGVSQVQSVTGGALVNSVWTVDTSDTTVELKCNSDASTFSSSFTIRWSASISGTGVTVTVP